MSAFLGGLERAFLSPGFGIGEMISQITAAGGLSRPNKFAVQIVPPRLNQATLINNGSALASNLGGVLNKIDQSGQAPQQFGITADFFKLLGTSSLDIPNRLDLMCSEAELPGKRFTVSQIRTYGSYFDVPYIDTYAPITLSFIVGRDMFERHFFDAWSYSIQDPGTSDFNYIQEYATTIDIYQLDEFNNANYGCRLFQAWPTTIGQMRLAYNENNSYHTLGVEFTYRKWINLRVNTSTPITIENTGTPNAFENTISRSK